MDDRARWRFDGDSQVIRNRMADTKNFYQNFIADFDFITSFYLVNIKRTQMLELIHPLHQDGFGQRGGIDIRLADFITDKRQSADMVKMAVGEKHGFNH